MISNQKNLGCIQQIDNTKNVFSFDMDILIDHNKKQKS